MVLRRRLSRHLLIPVLAVLWGPVACTGPEDRAAPEPRPALVAVATGEVGSTSGFTGIVRAADRAVLATAVPGRVTRVHVDLGERVRRGQALLTFDTTMLDAAVRAAEATVAEAEAAAREAIERSERAQAAAASGAASPTESRGLQAAAQAAEARVVAARAALTDARWQREQSSLRSPIDGVVAARQIEPGQTIAAGTPVIEIDGRGRELVVDLPASVPVAVGDRVVLHGPKGVASGVLLRWNERLEGAGVRRAIVQVPADARVGEVWSMRATAAAGVVYVPQRAIQRAATEPSTFVLRIADEAGTLAAVPVTTGALRGSSIEVVQGLAVGDRVVIAGASSLRVGDRVVPVDALR